MEQQNQSNSIAGMNPVVKNRPTFLTVLCILSFVGIGLVIIGSAYNLAIYSSSYGRQSLETANQILQSTHNPFGQMLGDTDEFISTTRTLGLVAIISALVCLAGVLLMWKLRKVGFYIYIVGEIAYPIAGLALSGRMGMGSSLFASLMVIGIFLYLIFAIAFIILYAVNLKHLN